MKYFSTAGMIPAAPLVGAVTTRHLEHCAAPLRRSVMAELEAEFPEDFRRTTAARFRSRRA